MEFGENVMVGTYICSIVVSANSGSMGGLRWIMRTEAVCFGGDGGRGCRLW